MTIKNLKMKKYILNSVAICLTAFLLLAFNSPQYDSRSKAKATTVKCLLQLKNYSGKKPYVVVSIVDENEKYEQTLYMQGQDDEWYNTLKEWWAQLGKDGKENIDAISGATINPGARAIIAFEIPEDKIGNHYQLRFESAVEDQDYHKKDLEVALTKENLKRKFDGSGYIRYVRLIAN